MGAPIYLHLPNGSSLPTLRPSASIALAILESIVIDEWRAQVCEWLARSGCRYFIAWGQDCEEWRGTMGEAALGGDAENLIITTAHTDEPLAEAMWFSVHKAYHPAVTLQTFMILHVTPVARREEILTQFEKAVRDE